MRVESVKDLLENPHAVPIDRNSIKACKKKYLCRRNAILVSMYQKGLISHPSSVYGNRYDLGMYALENDFLYTHRSGLVGMNFEGFSLRKLELGRKVVPSLEEMRILYLWEEAVKEIDALWQDNYLGVSSNKRFFNEKVQYDVKMGFYPSYGGPVGRFAFEALMWGVVPVRSIGLWGAYRRALEKVEGVRLEGVPRWASSEKEDTFVEKNIMEGNLGKWVGVPKGVSPIEFVVAESWEGVVEEIDKLISSHETLYLSGHWLFAECEPTMGWLDACTSGLYCLDVEEMVDMPNNTVDGVSGEFISIKSLQARDISFNGCPIDLFDNKMRKKVCVGVEQVPNLREALGEGRSNSSLFLDIDLNISSSIREGLYEGDESLVAALYGAMLLQQQGILSWMGVFGVKKSGPAGSGGESLGEKVSRGFREHLPLERGMDYAEARRKLQEARNVLKKRLSEEGML